MVMGFSGCSEESEDSTVSSVESGDNNQSEGSSGASDRPNEIRDITSVELVSEMKAGWNLGNTLDAGHAGSKGSEPTAIETSWGNPVTTKEMIDAVKEQGFNVLRVPVTWDWSTGEGPDYIISEEWMDRVQEVVNYGIDDDMFVILDIHHETWHDPYEDNYEAASDRMKKVWTQIGERFQNYDEHLIFEGMNEPRLRNTADEWNGGTDAAREVVNKLNADFVETIRSLGGNNPKRHLMIPGYAASSANAALSAIKVPDDDKIIVSVHGYIPYNFALATGGGANKYFLASRMTGDIDNLADTLKTLFIDKGQAVIIGEFGAMNRDNDPFRVHWVKYYITKMNEIGVPCVWWDNNANSGSGELFGLFNRRTLEWYSQDVADALIAAANGEFTLDEIIAESDELLQSMKNNE
ncbi:MAG: glycoside hydrolase family 5 protein [Eubacterium sp.]|nr:glycoside hydrolase family 5 protein [Eubacterium sp.]